jgi:DNA invertase Pin-like site-specific DNA recombinase
LFSSKTSITVHLNMSEPENGQLPLAKRTVRNRIAADIWEQIKTGYAAGVPLRELARKMNIPEGTVLYHAMRYGWTQQIKAATHPVPVPQSDTIAPLKNTIAPVQNVQSVPLSVAAILAEHERETKLSLARSARRMAKDAEQATLREAPYVHKAAQVASITHGWGEKEKNPNAILNVAILTGAEKPEKIIKAEECQDSGHVIDDQ